MYSFVFPGLVYHHYDAFVYPSLRGLQPSIPLKERMKKSLQEHLYSHGQYLTEYETNTEIEVGKYVEEIQHIYDTLRQRDVFYSQSNSVWSFRHPELNEVMTTIISSVCRESY